MKANKVQRIKRLIKTNFKTDPRLILFNGKCFKFLTIAGLIKFVEGYQNHKVFSCPGWAVDWMDVKVV